MQNKTRAIVASSLEAEIQSMHMEYEIIKWFNTFKMKRKNKHNGIQIMYIHQKLFSNTCA